LWEVLIRQVVLGCFGAGVVAVPMYPPLNVQRDVPKILKVIDNCKPRCELLDLHQAL
jgi:acyl-CoA synthetase (AMP-forming)/AMP-acid ligase II